MRLDLRSFFAGRSGVDDSPLDVILDRAPLFLWAVDAKGIFTMSAGNALASLGVEEGEVVGQSAYEIFADHAQIISNIRLALNGSECQANISFAGRSFDAHFVPRRHKDLSNERAEGVFGICIDITDRRRAEIALAATESRYRAIFQSSGAALILQDVSALRREFERLRAAGIRDLDAYLDENPSAIEGMLKMARIAQANETALKLYGLSEAAAINRAQTDFVPPESWHVTRQILVAHFRGEPGLTVKTTHLTAQGKQVHLIAHISFPRQNMLADSALVAIIDISAQVEAEQALSRSEQRSRSLVEAVAAPLIEIFWDTDGSKLGSVVAVNSAAMSLFSAESRAQLKREFGACLGDDQNAALNSAFVTTTDSTPVLLPIVLSDLQGKQLDRQVWFALLEPDRALLTLSGPVSSPQGSAEL